MNNPENAPDKNKSKVHAQTRDENFGPEVVDRSAPTSTALSVKDRSLANGRQKAILKKKKLSWRNIPWELLILLSPLLLFVALLAADPTAIHLLQAQYARTDAQQIDQYTAALKIRKDPEVLVQRAWAKYYTDYAGEFSDLEEARLLGAESGTIIYEMAVARAHDQGIDDRTIGLLCDSGKQSIKHFNKFPVDVTEDATTFNRTIYGLIACGKFKDAEKFLKTPPHTFYGNGERTLFGALLKREAEDFNGASTDLSECAGEMHPVYAAEPACFQALMALDVKDPKNASEWLNYSSNFKIRSYDWLVDYIAAWTAFENGDLKGAQLKSTGVINYLTDSRPAIVGLNGLAASHLLKANVLKKQGRIQQATIEFARFTECKNKGYTGKVLIPKPYRAWIAATHPNSKTEK
jgi:hypothetical protein